ncbi:MAG: radical SAM protein [Nitrososphaerota archaeon]
MTAEMVRAARPSLKQQVGDLYEKYGQRKPMGESAPSPWLPHFFLHRTFLGDQDLLIIFNTKRCKYRCHFCQLPAKSSPTMIPGSEIVAQFGYVMKELKHSLSVMDRLTFSNEGSVLDPATFPTEALLEIAEAVNELRRVRTLVLETRLEFVDTEVLAQVREAAPRVSLNILTGFETHDPYIRDKVLFKREPLDVFERGLDRVAEAGVQALTAYVLFKPRWDMSDEEAVAEAEASIDYLAAQATARGLNLSVRLNPMYAADGSRWAKKAHISPDYKPPRLTDVMRVAEKKRQEGVNIYIGMSTEGLDDGSNYMAREDYSPSLIKPVVLFNSGKINAFSGYL